MKTLIQTTFLFAYLFFASGLTAQTTVNLGDQCDCSAMTDFMTKAYQKIGTSTLVVPSGTEAIVPGTTETITITQPSNVLVTITGYTSVEPNSDLTHQGVFSIYQDGAKISSGFNWVGPSGGSAPYINLPVPVTITKLVLLNAGTYTFDARYAAWSGTVNVNLDPTIYAGYNGDSESMKTRLTILVTPQ